jgi:hypothetical protein
MAYQNVVMFWSDYGGGYWLRKISGSNEYDEWYQEWWARKRSQEFDPAVSHGKGQICHSEGGAPTGNKYICMQGYYNPSVGLGDAPYWSSDFYKPDIFSAHPEWCGYGDDLLGVNGSGFEGMLADYGQYDWYWCSIADGNHPWWPHWLIHLLEDYPESFPEIYRPIGCWRRMFKYTFGRPKKGNGEEIEVWKIWPGEEGDPPGYDPDAARKIMVTQASYSEILGGDSWEWCVAPTNAQIQSAWNALDPDVKAAVTKRHTHIDINCAASPDKPCYEADYHILNGLWGVMRYWQYIAAQDWLDITYIGIQYGYFETLEQILKDISPYGRHSSWGSMEIAVRSLKWKPWFADTWHSGHHYHGGDLVSAACPAAASNMGFNPFIINGVATFSCMSEHTSSGSFYSEWLQEPRLWSFTPIMPELYGFEGVNGGISHYINPTVDSTQDPYDDYNYGPQDFENGWRTIGYSLGYVYDQEIPGWYPFAEADTPIHVPRKVQAAFSITLKEAYWNDPYNKTIRLTALKNLKMRLNYRAIREGGGYLTDGCSIAIDGGVVNPGVAPSRDDQTASERFAYINFQLGTEADGSHNAHTHIDIVSDWPFDLFPTHNSMGSAKRQTQINKNIETTDGLGIIVEMDWDLFAEFVET